MAGPLQDKDRFLCLFAVQLRLICIRHIVTTPTTPPNSVPPKKASIRPTPLSSHRFRYSFRADAFLCLEARGRLW